MPRSQKYDEHVVHLAAAIREARRDAALTQQALADRAGLSIGTVRNLEQRAVSDPGIFEVHAMALAMNVTLDRLVEKIPPTSAQAEVVDH